MEEVLEHTSTSDLKVVGSSIIYEDFLSEFLVYCEE